jgi:hypothetical protein
LDTQESAWINAVSETGGARVIKSWPIFHMCQHIKTRHDQHCHTCKGHPAHICMCIIYIYIHGQRKREKCDYVSVFDVFRRLSSRVTYWEFVSWYDAEKSRQKSCPALLRNMCTGRRRWGSSSVAVPGRSVILGGSPQ